MLRPGFREIRLFPQARAELTLRDAPNHGGFHGHGIAVIAIRKEGRLGEHLARPGPLQDDRATMFLVPDQVNLAFQHDKERQHGLAEVKEALACIELRVGPLHEAS